MQMGSERESLYSIEGCAGNTAPAALLEDRAFQGSWKNGGLLSQPFAACAGVVAAGGFCFACVVVGV
jgi:hypothetical protein